MRSPAVFLRRPSAFTLVEMLVVIAVIAILAAILVPVGMNFMKKSRQVTSVGQVKSLCAGLIAFMQENGRYPMGYDRSKDEVWDKLIAPHATGSLGLRAPLDTLRRTVGSPEARNNPNKWRSYSMVRNERGGVVLGVAGRVWDTSLRRDSTVAAMVGSPGKTLLLVERFDPTNLRHNLSGSVIDSPAEQLAHGAALTVMRNGKPTFVYGFCDGHVEILHPEDTIGKGTLTNPRGMWTFEDGD